MQIITLTKKQFESLKKYKIKDNLFTAEGDFYILPLSNKWKTVKKLLKKFHNTSGKNYDNKIKTIKSLIELKQIINVPELVLPENLVQIDNEVIGYTMELIPSINLEEALLSNEIDVEKKIKYLSQIGIILEKMEYVRKYTELKEFYLNDVHENNFVVDLKSDSVRVVDVDSCKISDNISCTIGSKYLQPDTLITHIDKYKQDENFVYGCSFIPTRDTDLYCYTIMILNFIYGGEIEKLTIEEYYDYLEYLLSIGTDRQIINIFKKITTNSPNENPYKLLNSLIPLYGRMHKNAYKCNRKR